MKKVYRNATVLDGTKNMVEKVADILVEDGVIKKVGVVSEKCAEVDCQGKFIIPGLINLHVHIPANGFPKDKPTDNKKLVKILMSNGFTRWVGKKIMEEPMVKDELFSGVTTFRAVGGVGHYDSETRDAINASKLVGPRMIVCDSAVTIPNGHMEGTVAIGCHSDEEFIEKIEENIKAGVDWIKIMITGGVLDATVRGEPGEMKMNAHQVKICCDTAHKHGLKVCAHVESPMGIKVALENGVDTIEHGAAMDDETLKMFIDKGASLVCTISPTVPLAKFDPEVSKATEVQIYNTEVLFNGILEATKKCLNAGVTVGLGTDVGCPFVTHYDMWRELEYTHKLVGIDRLRVLHIATLVNASIIGVDKETGSIEEGKSADFIILNSNPMDGFDAIRDPRMVVFKGKEYTQKPKKNEICEKYLDEYLNKLN